VSKSVDPAQAEVGDTVTFTITVTNNGNVQATGVIVNDTLPDNLDYVSATSVDVNTSLARGTITLIPPRTVRVDIGTLDVTDEILITILAQVNSAGQPPILNTATVEADPTSAGVSAGPAENDSSTVPLTIGSPEPGGGAGGGLSGSLPATGFAPGIETALPMQPLDKMYAADGLQLEIPRLGVRISIVGVPLDADGEWDLTWLGSQAGYLYGTAYPTHAGNSVITAHVYTADGKPGPFVSLAALRYGDEVVIHLDGQRYVYQVREQKVVSPGNKTVFKHEEYPWLTLLTCKDFDPATNTYRHRVIVRAVLVRIESEAVR
jgi:LPXTG-site transpeptidase (sortase) family protein